MQPLSSLLLQRGVATLAEVEAALARQTIYGGDLVTNLLEVASLDEQKLVEVVADCEGLTPAAAGQLPNPEPEALRAVPADVALRIPLLPQRVLSEMLVVVVAEPIPPSVQEDLSFGTGLRLEQELSLRPRILQGIARAYGQSMNRRYARVIARLEGLADPFPSAAPLPPVSSDSLSPPRLSHGPAAEGPRQDASAWIRPVVPSDAARSSVATPATPLGDQPAAPKTNQVRRSSRPAAAREAKRTKPHKGPFTLVAARGALEDANSKTAAISVLFDFAKQFFEYAAIFVVRHDLAEGMDASGPGASRARIRGVGVPLEMRSVLSNARDQRTHVLKVPPNDGIDAFLRQDLQRPMNARVLVVPLCVRERVVALLYGDDGGVDVDLNLVGDVLAITPLVGAALEQLILRRKFETSQSSSQPPPLPPEPAPVQAGAGTTRKRTLPGIQPVRVNDFPPSQPSDRHPVVPKTVQSPEQESGSDSSPPFAAQPTTEPVLRKATSEVLQTPGGISPAAWSVRADGPPEPMREANELGASTVSPAARSVRTDDSGVLASPDTLLRLASAPLPRDTTVDMAPAIPVGSATPGLRNPEFLASAPTLISPSSDDEAEDVVHAPVQAEARIEPEASEPGGERTADRDAKIETEIDLERERMDREDEDQEVRVDPNRKPTEGESREVEEEGKPKDKAHEVNEKVEPRVDEHAQPEVDEKADEHEEEAELEVGVPTEPEISEDGEPQVDEKAEPTLDERTDDDEEKAELEVDEEEDYRGELGREDDEPEVDVEVELGVDEQAKPKADEKADDHKQEAELEIGVPTEPAISEDGEPQVDEKAEPTPDEQTDDDEEVVELGVEEEEDHHGELRNEDDEPEVDVELEPVHDELAELEVDVDVEPADDEQVELEVDVEVDKEAEPADDETVERKEEYAAEDQSEETGVKGNSESKPEEEAAAKDYEDEMVGAVLAELQESQTPGAADGELRDASPSRGAVVQAPRQPPKKYSPSDVGLPLVILNVGGEVDELIDQLESKESSKVDLKRVRNDLRSFGDRLVKPLLDRFPGTPTEVVDLNRVEMPLPSASGRVLRFVVELGSSIASQVAGLLANPDPEVRIWVVLTLAEMGGKDAREVVSNALFDFDARVRHAAKSTLRTVVGARAWANAVRTLVRRTAANEEDYHRRELAVEALGEIREASSVPILIEALGANEEAVRKAAVESLHRVTRHSLEGDVEAWNNWWNANARRARYEWLVDALERDDEKQRSEAHGELVEIVEEDLGFDPNKPSVERQSAIQAYREWWEHPDRCSQPAPMKRRHPRKGRRA